MSSVDLGLFDCFVTDKPSSTLDEFESLLYDTTARNILDISLQESGVSNNNTIETFNVSTIYFYGLFCAIILWSNLIKARSLNKLCINVSYYNHIHFPGEDGRIWSGKFISLDIDVSNDSMTFILPLWCWLCHQFCGSTSTCRPQAALGCCCTVELLCSGHFLKV